MRSVIFSHQPTNGENLQKNITPEVARKVLRININQIVQISQTVSYPKVRQKRHNGSWGYVRNNFTEDTENDGCTIGSESI